MTDRELLELAAKAAGYEYECTSHTGYPENDRHQIRDWFGCLVDWNPLDEDGDAFRLAVKMDMACSPGGQVFTHDDDLMSAWADKDVMYGTDFCQHVQWSKSKGDPYAATRRAIVRAAAEIGKDMK